MGRTLGNCESGGTSGEGVGGTSAAALGEPTGSRSVALPLTLSKVPLKLCLVRE